MARVHTSKRGSSHSIRPVSKRMPSWCGYQPEEVEAIITKLTKEGASSSRIGIVLRDQYGVPLTKGVTGKSVTKIQKEANVLPAIPDDLASLLRRANRMIGHVEKNKADHRNTHNLQMLESRIHRLATYYKKTGQLAGDWKYKPVVGSFL